MTRPTRVAINGFGRMGRLIVRPLQAIPQLELVHVNEIGGDAEMAAHLLAFDTVHGRYPGTVDCDGDAVVVDGARVGYSSTADPASLRWSELGVDLVLECTGAFRSHESLQPHLDAGAANVVVAAPVKSESVPNIVLGCNDDRFDLADHAIVSAASCTTNCLAPVVKVIHESFGIERGMITTIHDATNTQVVVDAPHEDLRRARSALNSLIPTTTGSATAITVIYPELTGRLDGLAVRVPLLNASLTDAVFSVERDVTVEEVNTALRQAAAGELEGILGFEDRPLVSADYTNDPRSGIVDGPATMVTDGRLVKVLIWYDNEMGYVHRMAELAAAVAASGDQSRS